MGPTRIPLSPEARAEIDAGRFVHVGPAWNGWVVGKVGGAWKAYLDECRHRAIPLGLGARSVMSDDGRFLLCHQHGALYRPVDGKCFVGPCAGESLVEVGVVDRGDAIEVG